MKRKNKRTLALFLTGALLAGVLPVGLGTGPESRAAEQPALRNPRILKTTQEMAPGSSEKKELKNPTTENGITTWDSIWFGNYWQEDTSGDGKADKADDKTPIKWRVLSVEGDDVFLLADQILDVQRYNDTYTEVTWETCTMRSWLNGYGAEKNKEGKDYSDNNFLDTAFSEVEQSAIETADVATEGGINTSDKVYLLSVDEVGKTEYGFTSSADMTNTRQAVCTAYMGDGGEIQVPRKSRGNAWWFLRSPESSYNAAYGVSFTGRGGMDMNGVSNGAGVRPALHLNLKAVSDAISASGWSYAGTVSSDNLVEWDSIWFGNYWQEDTNGDRKADKEDEKTPIRWRVLSVEGDDVFLLADQNLDVQRYNDTDTEVTWETCTMRSWLNGYGAEENKEGNDYSHNSFIGNAFSVGEQSAIRTTNVVNDDNPVKGSEGGENITDKVYLLSPDEVGNREYGFISVINSLTNTRQAADTAYAADGREQGMESVWWLRSLGSASWVQNTMCWLSGGDVRYQVGVRPALHLNLSSDSGWSFAGSVTSDGRVEEPGTPTPAPTGFPAPTEPVETQTPQETAGPVETQKPEETAGPVETQKPEETVGPEETQEPSVPPAPTGPVETQEPSVPPAPTEPVETQEPSVPPAPTGPVETQEPSVPPAPTEPVETQEPSVPPAPTGPVETQEPSVPPAPTEPVETQEPSVPPAPTEPVETQEPSVPPAPTGPVETQNPQETAGPGIPSYPGDPSVIPSATQPGFSVGITSDPGKAAIGKVSALKLKQKKGTVKASWKKITGVKGYQICYSASKKWKNKKQKLVTKTKAVIKKLKKKKTYYFRVRAYRMEGTKKVYGAWSSVKKIRIRK